MTGSRGATARWAGLALSAALIMSAAPVAGAVNPTLDGAERPAHSAAFTSIQSTPEPATAPTTASAEIPETEPAAAALEWLRIDAAGIDVKILPLTPSAEDVSTQSIVPPFTLDAYWLTSYGTPGRGSADTTYITGHSWDNQDAPFNRLSTHTEIGDEIVLTTAAGTLDYVVDSITTHNKDTLKDSKIWDISPHRLVLISCYTEDPWGKNVVITASPAP